MMLEMKEKKKITVVSQIWEFFDYQCGKLLAPLIRLMIDYLTDDPEFAITPEFVVLS